MCLLASTFLRQILFIGLLTLAFLRGAKAQACTTERLSIFIAAAQNFAPESAPLGAALLSCPAEGPEAWFWWAMTESLRARLRQGRSRLEDRTRALESWKPTVESQTEPERLIEAAYQGRSAELRARWAAKEAAYLNNAEALRALARSLVVREAFEDGARVYGALVAMSTGVELEQARVEYSFALIWAGFYGELKTLWEEWGPANSPYEKDSRTRALALMALLEAKGLEKDPAKIQILEARFNREDIAEQWVESRWKVATDGRYLFEYERMKSRDLSLRQPLYESHQVGGGFFYEVMPGAELRGLLTWHNFKKGLGYKTAMQSKWGQSLINVEVERQPLLGLKPLSLPEDPYRFSMGLKIRFSDQWRSALVVKRDGNLAPFFDYLLEQKSYLTAGSEFKWPWILGLDSILRNRPSPYEPSDFLQFGIYGGLGLELKRWERFHGELGALYRWSRAMGFEGSQFRDLTNYEARAKLNMDLSQSLLTGIELLFGEKPYYRVDVGKAPQFIRWGLFFRGQF